MKSLVLVLVSAFAVSAFAQYEDTEAKKERGYTCYVTDSEGAVYTGRRQIFDRSKHQTSWRVLQKCRAVSDVPETCRAQGCVKDEKKD